MNSNMVKIDFLNVGFGDCIVVRLLNTNKTIVIDGGDLNPVIYERNRYRITLINYLKRHDIGKIDLLVLTHPHIDHIGGILQVAEKLAVKEVWCSLLIDIGMTSKEINTDNANMNTALNTYNKILSILANKGTSIKYISEKIVKEIDALEITVFKPDTRVIDEVNKSLAALYNEDCKTLHNQIINRIDKQLNGTSLVLKINFLNKSILLTSDISSNYLVKLLKNEDIKVDILKASHHGDIRNISESLLKNINPQYIVVSADDEFTYNLPSTNISEFIYNSLTEVKLLFTYKVKFEDNVKQHSGITFMLNEEGSISYEYF